MKYKSLTILNFRLSMFFILLNNLLINCSNTERLVCKQYISITRDNEIYAGCNQCYSINFANEKLVINGTEIDISKTGNNVIESFGIIIKTETFTGTEEEFDQYIMQNSAKLTPKERRDTIFRNYRKFPINNDSKENGICFDNKNAEKIFN